MSYELTRFTLRDMTECGAALRQSGAGARTMEAAAGGIVRFLYTKFTDGKTGKPACALVRFFKTHTWGGLEPGQQEFASRILGKNPEPSTQCLTLLATAGDQPDWNDRRRSTGHQAIPLASEAAVAQAPMVSTLMRQFGVDVSSVLRPNPDLILDLAQRTFNVFHVPEAPGSAYIPAQKEFVVPCEVRSVLGMGGVLPSGSLFAVILFSHQPISRETAELFKPMALNIKMAVLPFEDTVFASAGGAHD